MLCSVNHISRVGFAITFDNLISSLTYDHAAWFWKTSFQVADNDRATDVVEFWRGQEGISSV